MVSEVKVTILGARGSIPVCAGSFLRYGGATTCAAVRMGHQLIVLDAGTGLLDLPKVMHPEEQQVTVLLSHPHIDHMMGFPMCPTAFRRDVALDIYGVNRQGLTVQEQFERMMSPPLWPVTPNLLPAQISFHDLPEIMHLDGVTVETLEGNHPGGVSLFRLSTGKKRVVFMSDFTLRDEEYPALLEFARNCDLLLCDGQYSLEEWATRSGFGHNTWIRAAQFGRECGARQVRIIHHDPGHSDEYLDAAQKEVRQIHSGCTFGWQGEEIEL